MFCILPAFSDVKTDNKVFAYFLFSNKVPELFLCKNIYLCLSIYIYIHIHIQKETDRKMFMSL